MFKFTDLTFLNLPLSWYECPPPQKKYKLPTLFIKTAAVCHLGQIFCSNPMSLNVPENIWVPNKIPKFHVLHVLIF